MKLFAGVVVVVAVVFLFAGTAGAQIFGSPSATLEQGTLSLGMSGGYEERELNLVGGRDCDYLCYSNDLIVSYGIIDWLEVFLKVGLHYPQMEFQNVGLSGDFHLNSTEPGIGIGARATLWEDGELSLGWVNQVRWDFPSDRLGSTRESTRLAQIDTMIGPSYTTDSWSAYCGVLGSFVGGRLNEGGFYTGEFHDDAVGAVIGGSVKLMDNVDMVVEGSGMSGGWSMSGGVKMTF